MVPSLIGIFLPVSAFYLLISKWVNISKLEFWLGNLKFAFHFYLFARITHDSKTDPVWYEKHNNFLGETNEYYQSVYPINYNHFSGSRLKLLNTDLLWYKCKKLLLLNHNYLQNITININEKFFKFHSVKLVL